MFWPRSCFTIKCYVLLESLGSIEFSVMLGCQFYDLWVGLMLKTNYCCICYQNWLTSDLHSFHQGTFHCMGPYLYLCPNCTHSRSLVLACCFVSSHGCILIVWTLSNRFVAFAIGEHFWVPNRMSCMLSCGISHSWCYPSLILLPGHSCFLYSAFKMPFWCVYCWNLTR
jgi:hypothetical protein